MRIHKLLPIILILVLAMQVMLWAEEPARPGELARRAAGKRAMTASIVRVDILRSYTNLSRGPSQSIILNGSIIDSYHPKIVEVYPTTGVVLDDKGHILAYIGERWISWGTPPYRIEILMPGDQRKATGRLVGVDERTGFAVIASPEVKLQPARIEAPDHCKVGNIIYAIDFLPKAYMPVIRMGRIQKQLARPSNGARLVVSVPSHSEYGAAVVDREGNIIGILTGLMPYPLAHGGLAQKTVFPLAEILPAAQKIISTGHSIPSGWVGVYLDDLTPEIKQRLNLKVEQGVLVKGVVKGSPAEKAGMLENDIIVQYDGTRIYDMKQFVQLVRETPIGRKVAVTVVRDNRPRVLRLTIEKRSEEMLQEQLRRLQQPLEIDAQELERRLLKMQEQLEQTELRLQAEKMNQAEIQKLQKQFQEIQKSLFEEALANPPTMSFRRPTLGLFTDNLTPQLGEYFGVKGGRGVLITSVTEGSQSEKAGLKAGDVIVKIDDKEIPNRSVLARELSGKQAGSKIKVSVLRDKNPMDFYLTMERKLPFRPKPPRPRR